jgi:hypothetical protein
MSTAPNLFADPNVQVLREKRQAKAAKLAETKAKAESEERSKRRAAHEAALKAKAKNPSKKKSALARVGAALIGE